MPCYFFSGKQYIRVTRSYEGPGTVDAGYPAAISNWNWGSFGQNGIDAAMYSGPVDYFFSGNQYIRVTRGATGPGQIDAGYPKPISTWGWGAFGANGIDAALWSDTACYFFKGNQYIRVTRADEGPGTVDTGYPANISVWGWGEFGKNGIDAALNSGPVDYFFSGNQYIRVTRGDEGPGKIDPGYPAPISNWNWKGFGANGIHGALFSGADFSNPVALSPLGSNSNYLLANGGGDLSGLSVTLDLTQDLVVKSNGPPQKGASSVSGFTLQLNCYSPDKETDAWQQYVIGFNGSNVYGQINNWQNLTTFLVNKTYSLASFSGLTVPAFHKLRISLQMDAKNNVSGVQFWVFDVNGRVAGSKGVTLTDILSAADLSPIVAFELNLVGPGNSESATFSSGAGTLTYQFSQALTPSASKPADAEANLITAETANTTYGTLSGTASNYFTQSFAVSATATPESMSLQAAKFRPQLKPPAPGPMN